MLADKEGGEGGADGHTIHVLQQSTKAPPWAGCRLAGGGFEGRWDKDTPILHLLLRSLKKTNKNLLRWWFSATHGQTKNSRRHGSEVLLGRYYCRGQRSSSAQSEKILLTWNKVKQQSSRSVRVCSGQLNQVKNICLAAQSHSCLCVCGPSAHTVLITQHVAHLWLGGCRSYTERSKFLLGWTTKARLLWSMSKLDVVD